MRDNYTLEGLERVARGEPSIDTPPDYGDYLPDVDDRVETGNVEPHDLLQEYKYGTLGRRFAIDARGKMITRSSKWVPEQVPEELWTQSP